MALASVLVMEPQVLLLDEPTAGLDPRSSLTLLDLIAETGRRGATVLTATATPMGGCGTGIPMATPAARPYSRAGFRITESFTTSAGQGARRSCHELWFVVARTGDAPTVRPRRTP